MALHVYGRRVSARQPARPCRSLDSGHQARPTATLGSSAVDGIAQFYPWRHFAGETVRNGLIPLWNPYQFCGTPFVANNQSAGFLSRQSPVLHPAHCPRLRRQRPAAPYALRLVHLSPAASAAQTERPARRRGLMPFTWQVNWLQLPTFLATSCWFPLLLRQIHVGVQVFRVSGVQDNAATVSDLQNASAHNAQRIPLNTRMPEHLNTVKLALVVGLMLLAGHLQIAFYGLLAGSLWAMGLLMVRTRRYGTGYGARFLGVCVAGLVLGGMLALPQILPTLELSRLSHRQGQAKRGRVCAVCGIWPAIRQPGDAGPAGVLRAAT